jgi:hypothetical protein
LQRQSTLQRQGFFNGVLAVAFAEGNELDVAVAFARKAAFLSDKNGSTRFSLTASR